MPAPRRHLRLDAEPLHSALAALRQDLEVPGPFSPEVVACAEGLVDRHAEERADERELPLLAVDPVGARDLDQAFAIERDGSGWLLRYAIADVAAFVVPGDPVDLESWSRGTTLYLPDGSAPLHPPVLSEGKASLLPGIDRPAVLWRLRFDQRGELTGATAERALVRVRVATSYQVMAAVAAGETPVDDDGPRGIDLQEPGPDVVDRAAVAGIDLAAMAHLLAELGSLRAERERDRGGVSLQLPEQEVAVGASGFVELETRPPLDVEEHNAQLSLATGMAAAAVMLDAEVGLLRTLPPPQESVLDELRARSQSLGHPWPADGGYPEWVRSLDPSTPVGMALSTIAGRGLRGSGYTSLDGSIPDLTTHAAVAAPYAHVTAPLRRLGDRYATEVVLAVTAGRQVPAWARDRLEELPDVLHGASRRGGAVDRAVVDLLEAAVLASRRGETFPAVVIGRSDGRARLQLVDPPVLADATVTEVDVGDGGSGPGEIREGTVVRARLVEADPMTRTTRFELDT